MRAATVANTHRALSSVLLKNHKNAPSKIHIAELKERWGTCWRKCLEPILHHCSEFLNICKHEAFLAGGRQALV